MISRAEKLAYMLDWQRRKYATDPVWAEARRNKNRVNALRHYHALTLEQRVIRQRLAKQKRRINGKAQAVEAMKRVMKMQQRCTCCMTEELEKPYLVAALIPAEVDHKIPLAVGGHHCVKNLQVLTIAAHVQKTARDARRLVEIRMRNRFLKVWRI